MHTEQRVPDVPASSGGLQWGWNQSRGHIHVQGLGLLQEGGVHGHTVQAHLPQGVGNRGPHTVAGSRGFLDWGDTGWYDCGPGFPGGRASRNSNMDSPSTSTQACSCRDRPSLPNTGRARPRGRGYSHAMVG